MTPYPGKGDPEKMKACQGLSLGDVSVWSGNGEGIWYFGELIAVGMKDRGSLGALVDGGIRDIRWIGAHGYPVYARYRTPVQSIGRWKVVEWQKPVYLRGATARRVTVSPGDFILADEDGAIVHSAERRWRSSAAGGRTHRTGNKAQIGAAERDEPGAGPRQIWACLGFRGSGIRCAKCRDQIGKKFIAEAHVINKKSVRLIAISCNYRIDNRLVFLRSEPQRIRSF